MVHHEQKTSKEILEALGVKAVEQGLGPTGRFPEGKLTSNDEGEIQFAVGVLKGKVVMNFGSPVASLGMNPIQARKLGETLIQKAEALTESPARANNERKRRRRKRKR